jgi:hypothetical protein
LADDAFIQKAIDDMKKRAEKRKKKTKPNNNKVHDLYKN